MSFEEMYEKCGEIYYKDYADGEYCHEQSFRWGFQEAWDLFTQQPIDEEKLDNLSEDYMDSLNPEEGVDYGIWEIGDAYKAGYRDYRKTTKG